MTRSAMGLKSNTTFKHENEATTDMIAGSSSRYLSTNKTAGNTPGLSDDREYNPAVGKSLFDTEDVTPEKTNVTNIKSCLQNDGQLAVIINTRRQFYFFHMGKNVTDSDNIRQMTCRINITTTKNERLQVSVRLKGRGICDEHNCITVSSDGVNYEWEPCDQQATVRQNVGNDMTLCFSMADSYRSYFIKVNLVAMVTDLEVVRLSWNQGYIQTAGNDRWEHYLNQIDTWQKISPPPDYVTLLSVSRFYVGEAFSACTNDVVEVYAGGQAMENIVWFLCGSNPPLPKLLETPKIYVHFKSDKKFQTKGFRLTFSYHPTLLQPLRGNDSMWNCSSTEWPHFQRHFLCNLVRECKEWEDEAECFYSGHCGHDFLTLDTKCYKYVVSDQPQTWNEANLDCAARGGHLVSLNTPKEWKVVTEFIKDRPFPKSVFVGLKTTSPLLPIWYRNSWKWNDDSIAYFMKGRKWFGSSCSYLTLDSTELIDLFAPCYFQTVADYLCEFIPPEEKATQAGVHPQNTEPVITFPSPSTSLLAVQYTVCPAGHVTHDFMACDEKSVCWSSHRGYIESMTWGVPSKAACSAPMTSLPVMFSCRSVWQHVPYSLVCDHRWQCSDGSDESFCEFPTCSGSTPLKCVTSDQCVSRYAFCDYTQDCVDHSDESDCTIMHAPSCRLPPPPAVLNFDPASLFKDCSLFRYDPIVPRQDNESSATPCPHTHFQCPGGGYCLPVFLRCNEVADCPGREDEAGCDVSVCPGFYRCRSSRICLHVSSVCDGISDCSEQDDELYCHIPPCPQNCACHGLAFTCYGIFPTMRHPHLRYLSAEHSGLSAGQLTGNSMLIHLSLADCGVQTLDNFCFPNLRSLDLSDNLITRINWEQLRAIQKLQVFILSGNPLATLSFSDAVIVTMNHLESVHLSRTTLDQLDFDYFKASPNLQNLSIAQSQVKRIYRSGNRSMGNIRVLDLTHSQVAKFDRDVLSNMDSLDAVFAETYKLCCSWVLPPVFNPKDCHAPLDRVASCHSLLASPFSRIILALCCCFALLGNVVSIVVRVFVVRSSGYTSTDEFVTHITAGDMLMGLSVAVVAVANRAYQGHYALEDTVWRNSVWCKMVLFLFLLSSLVSVALVFLVTLDRLLSVSFVCRQSFTPVSARAACAFVWTGSAVVAALPVPLTMADTELFGETAACFPLLGTKEPFARASISGVTIVVVVFNFILTLFTAVGQTYINIAFSHFNSTVPSRQHKPSAVKSVTASSEVDTARRVFSPCMLNAACWLPLCALAALAWLGSPLPDVLHVQVGMLAVPATSALRPALYAVGVKCERSRRKKMQRLVAYIAIQHQRRGRIAAKP